MSVNIKIFFDPDTDTFTYVVTDPNTLATAVIDSVLNYDQFSGRHTTKSADEVIKYITDNKLDLQWILETHIHADHLTAATYIQEQLGGETGIGARITDILELWLPIFNTQNDMPIDGSQFQNLFADNQVFKLGSVDVKVIYTPGHTPACASYLIEDNIFVGDTLFMPDVGTARTDFPGGSADTMYDSITRIYTLPDNTRVYSCHDYPPAGRGVACMSTIGEQKVENVLINQSISKQKYVDLRNAKDKGKAVPKMLLPSIQVNLRSGAFGNQEDNGVRYIKIPVDKI